ncbi:hypothetical protein ACJMK2_013136 [Sinanodonta woodiana]|uniref:G-protein coupled receptors family 1 profile domain-containing protein n=1 Tax=Sinanodonta woodiana TaxID=1069815 RepID=A0ABD3VBK2_SINWO
MFGNTINTNKSEQTIRNLNNQIALGNIGGIFFIGISMIVGIPGNVIVMYIYLQKYRPSTIGHLSFVSYPIEFFSNDLVSKVFHFLTYCLIMGSAFVLVTIAAERHRKICTPHGKQLSEKIGIEGIECTVSDDFAGTKYPSYFCFVLLFLFIVSVIPISIMYALIGKQVWKMNKRSYRKNRATAITEVPCSTVTYNAAATKSSEDKNTDLKNNSISILSSECKGDNEIISKYYLCCFLLKYLAFVAIADS